MKPLCSTLTAASAFVATFAAMAAIETIPGGCSPAGIATIAQARVGHPLTPLSGAGVARRTARRTTRRVMALPAGCIYGTYYGGSYYRCGSTYYSRDGSAYVQVVF